MDSPRVSIIVLNWNGWRDTIECLESLYQIAYPNYDVIVVDNGSTDDSVRNLEMYAEGKIEVKSRFVKYNKNNKPISVMRHQMNEIDGIEFERTEISASCSDRRLVLLRIEKNIGYAEANNVGIRFASRVFDMDYVLLLNNDIVVASDFLDQMIGAAEALPKAGIFSPKVYFYRQPERIQLTWNRVELVRGSVFLAGAGEIDRGQFDEITETDYSQGVCFLIRRATIDSLGLFDSKFFCYFEETDYCFRARKAGIKSIYVPKARIWHKVSQTTNKIDGYVLYYMTRNRFWFTKRHALPRQYFSFILFFFTVELWKSFLNLVARRNSVHAMKSYLRGVLDGMKTGSER
jgi:GT2 family glycosyltransferase